MRRSRTRGFGDRRSIALLGCLFAAGAGTAWAQEAPPLAPGQQQQTEEVEELVVVAQPGTVIGNVAPEVQLAPEDIQSYGASSITELLEAIAPLTGSIRGRSEGQPITLVNGARISSFREIRDLPPEAILRMDILPEEVALRYGYRPDQRVVNFVLRSQFRSVTTEGEFTAPTDGGREDYETDLDLLRIGGDNRFQLNLEATAATALMESERSVIAEQARRPYDLIGNVTRSPFMRGAEIDPALSALTGRTVSVAGVPTTTGAPGLSDFTGERTTPIGDFRTLQPATKGFSANAILTRPLGRGISGTLNATFEASDSKSLLGLAESSLLVPAANPFSPFASDVDVYVYPGGQLRARRSETVSGHLGGSVNGAVAGWRWSFTGNADRSTGKTWTGAGVDSSALQAAVLAGDPELNPFTALSTYPLPARPDDFARSITTSGDATLVANGTLFSLPAGDVAATFTAGGSTARFESFSVRRGVTRSADLSRDIGQAQVNLDLPVSSLRNDVLTWLGDLSFNTSLTAEQLSDFGMLTTSTFGMNWTPVRPLRLIASLTEEDGAPTVQQLGDPETDTPGTRVFDFLRNETVEVTRISGGNPDLIADSRRVIRLGANVKPWDQVDFTVRGDYVRTRISDVIASFPTATPEIEAAFPERFVRDADGALVQIDSRPLNFQRQEREQVRWGLRYNRRLGAPPRQAGGRGGPGAASRGGPGGNRGGGGNFQVSLFHTLRLKEQIFIRPGLPALDLLNGSALGSSGGQPRHQVDLDAGVSRSGFGARTTLRWVSGTEVRGGVQGAENLLFSDFATVDLRFFADLGSTPLAESHPWLRGARLSLTVDNLFNNRQSVRTAAGETPISYQPELLDPLGRTVTLSFRKIFL